MATQYQIPPWIQAPDIAADYAKGVQVAQQAALEQQRLAMQQEENQRAHLMEQQRLEVEKSYKDQELSMRKQELDQTMKLNQLKINDAAQSLDARNKYQQFIQSGGPGGTPGDPAAGLLKFGPAMDAGTLSGYASLIKFQDLQKYGAVPESPVGKLQFDRRQALSRGDDEAVSQIDEAIKSATAKGKLTESERDHLKLSAHNMMNRRPGERPTDPAYLSRTQFASQLLKELDGVEVEKKKRVKVKGPKGERGTIEEGDTLPDGWSLAQ